MRFASLRRTAVAGLVLIGIAGAASAHHGWSWVNTSETFTLTGRILDIYIGNPHVTLELDVDGTQWHVDLAPLLPTTQAGFNQNSAMRGDVATLYGHRSLNPDQPSMKAVRIEVNGQTYDVYPDRVAPFNV